MDNRLNGGSVCNERRHQKPAGGARRGLVVLLRGAAMLAGTCAVGGAHAGGVQWSIGVQGPMIAPGVTVGAVVSSRSRAPRYVQPAVMPGYVPYPAYQPYQAYPVYPAYPAAYAAPVAMMPAPVYVPRVVYRPQRYYAPPPVVMLPPPAYGWRGHRHHRHWD